MKLYDTPLAPNPRRVRWVMAEKEIADVEVITLNLMEGQHRTPDYLAKAGLANVPMLEMDDGTCVTESIAICRYLESRYPEPNLFGRTPEEVAVIEMWLRRVEMMIATPLMIGVRHTHPAMGALEQQAPAVGEHSLQGATRALKVLDRQLEGRDWVAADRLTIADIVAFTALDFGRMIKFRSPEELRNLARWADAMRARPAAKAGMPQKSTA
ncbi:MAG: glutathione S-transferase [Phenylobacterium sp. RIFCSPHIGHO2_01_FULL_69_31]|uniref:glutathione S-transferase family protein n=1 Tax=Phenylobacterium sp. RIFCSPHIGHO2_01_FULL_69_31 TaxID=1801944 RepID=UPI0008D3D57D|nr:glutathione S-transferase [Phenylobacterium sp. RIFCSPHIGHO2_01_FULL_69_31]OHB28884.1 MAG: glutathione S-transferase [Phenylobacterium sp. RIFCSPHIGHO2_01_FULL_69_31]